MIDVCIIGCGNMGSAIIKGLSKKEGKYNIIGCDKDQSKLEEIKEYCSKTVEDLKKATEYADIIVLAVKPKNINKILDEIDLLEDQDLVSVAAAVSTDILRPKTKANVVRIMPNLAAEKNEMAAAVTTQDNLSEKVVTMLEDLGEYVEIDETSMDTATAINGSGPAFVFYLIKSMKKAGEKSDLTESEVEKLVLQTFKGATEIVSSSDKTVDELIESVCSPGGTTIEGMKVLRDSEIDQILPKAVSKAEKRSEEISEEVSNKFG